MPTVYTCSFNNKIWRFCCLTSGTQKKKTTDVYISCCNQNQVQQTVEWQCNMGTEDKAELFQTCSFLCWLAHCSSMSKLQYEEVRLKPAHCQVGKQEIAKWWFFNNGWHLVLTPQRLYILRALTAGNPSWKHTSCQCKYRARVSRMCAFVILSTLFLHCPTIVTVYSHWSITI